MLHFSLMVNEKKKTKSRLKANLRKYEKTFGNLIGNPPIVIEGIIELRGSEVFSPLRRSLQINSLWCKACGIDGVPSEVLK